jgi:ABC-2 type transport system permease protein/oleandomycin transport system permease protein
MTATAVSLPGTVERHGLSRVAGAFADIRTVAWRNLLAYVRVPQLLVFSTIQPVVFVLLFRYAFGGAVRVRPGTNYVDLLMPGIFTQTVVFGAIATAIGLATDLNAGLIERFRSLPMARSAVLAGRTTADLVRNAFVVLLMFAVGYAIGFRVHTNVVAALGGILLVITGLLAGIGMKLLGRDFMLRRERQ